MHNLVRLQKHKLKRRARWIEAGVHCCIMLAAFFSSNFMQHFSMLAFYRISRGKARHIKPGPNL
jgi:hypothetical protein